MGFNFDEIYQGFIGSCWKEEKEAKIKKKEELYTSNLLDFQAQK